jgi:hypothetical protein
MMKLRCVPPLFLLVLLAVVPDGRAAVHARVAPSADIGAGWASDLFLGARLGSSVEARIAPALRLDLSLAPSLKLFTGYDFALGIYEATQSTSLSHRAAAGTRVRLSRRWTGELGGSFEAESLSVARAIDEATGAEASESQNFAVHPSVRFLGESLSFEAFYTLGSRQLRLEDGTRLDDLLHLAVLSAGTTIGPLWATLSLRGSREDSTAEVFSYWGAAVFGSIAARPLSRLTVRLSASAHRNEFDTGRRDVLVKAAFSPTVRLTSMIALESSYSYALNSSNSEWLDASRHFVYLGVRAQGELWLR